MRPAILHRLLPALLTAILLLGGGSAARAMTVQTATSPGGAEAWLVEDHSQPLLSLRLTFRGGAAEDPAEKTGLSRFATALLDEGAGDLDSTAFQEKLDDLAVRFSAGASDDEITISLKTLTRNRTEAFRLLALALAQPRFDPEAIDRVRAQMRTALLEAETDPDSIAELELARHLFPTHPYGRPTMGTKAGLDAITAADFPAWAKQHLRRDRVLITAAGDITAAELAALLDPLLAGLPVSGPPVAVSDIQPQADGSTTLLRRPLPQSVAVFAQPGLSRRDPDWYAATVLNYLLGGGSFSSRLMQEVRVKRGLAYGISTSLEPDEHSPLISGQVGTRNGKIGETLSVLRQVWGEMAQGQVAERDLTDAKTYLIDSFAMQLVSNDGIAGILMAMRRYDLGKDYLDQRAKMLAAVRAADLQRVAKRLLDPAKLTVVVVGNPPDGGSGGSR